MVMVPIKCVRAKIFTEQNEEINTIVSYLQSILRFTYKSEKNKKFTNTEDILSIMISGSGIINYGYQ